MSDLSKMRTITLDGISVTVNIGSCHESLGYPRNWNLLRIGVLVRDRFLCKTCGGSQELTVSHVDHDKSNCDPANLRTLCMSCHMKWDAHEAPGNLAYRGAVRSEAMRRSWVTRRRWAEGAD